MSARAVITLGGLGTGQQYGKAVLPHSWEATMEITSVSDTGDGSDRKIVGYSGIESEHYGAYSGGTAVLWTESGSNKCTFSDIPATISISGYVKDEEDDGIEDITVSSGGYSDDTSSSGYWWFSVTCPFTGTLTPSESGYSFDPTTISLSNRYWNVVNNNFVGSVAPPPGKAQNPTPADDAEGIKITGTNRLKKLEWDAPD